jgi:hypothetical protein
MLQLLLGQRLIQGQYDEAHDRGMHERYDHHRLASYFSPLNFFTQQSSYFFLLIHSPIHPTKEYSKDAALA